MGFQEQQVIIIEVKRSGQPRPGVWGSSGSMEARKTWSKGSLQKPAGWGQMH
jgi:hypothetical protein